MRRQIAVFFMLLVSIIISANLAVNAAPTNDFPIGQILSARDQNTISTLKRPELYQKTVGRVRQNAVLKYDTVAKYIAARGEPSLEGKSFEALTAERFNKLSQQLGRGDRLFPTAALGHPTDVADLVRLSKSGRVLGRYQLKAGVDAAIKALSEPKYAGMKIVMHPERLATIKKDLAKETISRGMRGKPLSPYWQTIDDAVKSRRLTGAIAGMKVPNYPASLRAGMRYIKRAYELAGKKLMPTAARMMVSRIMGKVLAGADIGFGGYVLYDASMRYQRGHLDGDIFVGKMVVGVGLVVTGAGTVILLCVPEPVFTKAMAVVLVVASATLAVADIALDWIQSRRTESQRRLLAKIGDTEKRRVVHQLLVKQIQML